MSITREQLESAGQRSGLTTAQVDQLWDELKSEVSPEVSTEVSPEGTGVTGVRVAAFCGVMLVVLATALVLAEGWEKRGPGFVAAVVGGMTVVFGLVAWRARARDRFLAGLFASLSVCAVPVTALALQELLGLRHEGGAESSGPGEWLRSGRAAMELSSLAASLLARRFFAFGFLAAPLAIMLLVLFLETVQMLAPELPGEWFGLWSALFGATMVGLTLWRARRAAVDAPDHGFWLHLVGLTALSGGLWAAELEREPVRLLVALLHVGLMVAAVLLRRVTFLVFGVGGVALYIGHLAWRVFEGSMLFPLSMVAVGVVLIFVAAGWSRRRDAWRAWLLGLIRR